MVFTSLLMDALPSLDGEVRVDALHPDNSPLVIYCSLSYLRSVRLLSSIGHLHSEYGTPSCYLLDRCGGYGLNSCYLFSGVVCRLAFQYVCMNLCMNVCVPRPFIESPLLNCTSPNLVLRILCQVAYTPPTTCLMW